MQPDGGLGTPKFNEEPTTDENVYVKKRELLLQKREFFAMENYRSETAAAKTVSPTASRGNIIRSMDCRVKHIRINTGNSSANGEPLRGHWAPGHSS